MGLGVGVRLGLGGAGLGVTVGFGVLVALGVVDGVTAARGVGTESFDTDGEAVANTVI